KFSVNVVKESSGETMFFEGQRARDSGGNGILREGGNSGNKEVGSMSSVVPCSDQKFGQ
ncbi:hypothetical protein Ancab_028595, partial [Ancistrocladus abbreviatus]